MHWCRASAEPKRTEARGRSARLYAPAIGVWWPRGAGTFTGAVNLRRARSPVACSTLINSCQATPEVSKLLGIWILVCLSAYPFIDIIAQFIMVASKRGLSAGVPQVAIPPSSTTLPPTDSRRSTDFQQHHDVMISSEITQPRED